MQNNGFARKIYSAADASLQLEGFYKEVSSPVLNNVQFNYKDSPVVALTDTMFHTFYQGGEMVVAGMVSDQAEVEPVIEYKISANQAIGQYQVSGIYEKALSPIVMKEVVDTYIDVIPDVLPKTSFMERLWAYLTIQNLLRKVARGELMSCDRPKRSTSYLDQLEGGQMRFHSYLNELKGRQMRSTSYVDELEGSGVDDVDMEDDEDMERLLNALESDVLVCNNLERALYLSLHYQFVTPLTSLVVVKPNQREKGDFAQADKFGQIRMDSGGEKIMGDHLMLGIVVLITSLVQHVQ
jgi:hypothetical protein